MAKIGSQNVKIMDDMKVQRSVLDIVNTVSKRLETDKRVYWSFIIDLTHDNQDMLKMTLDELKMRDFDIGTARRPYIEKASVSSIPRVAIW